jgi:predicted enzyme related to lactoylglutathione lyase
MTLRYSITIDVPDLDRGLAFYGAVLGLRETARPIPSYAILGDGPSIGIMEKAAGTAATLAPGTERRYDRHWTPVHADFHVDDLEAALTAVEREGGAVEQRHSPPGRPGIAFCADPFGHGFCLLGPRQ